jgi:ubiquinone/menaquinone biosynthesis C-methylase UbiE
LRRVDSKQPEQVPLVEYLNTRGEPIRAIIDTVGDTVGAPAVIIPPAWGRTKETLGPLAATITETFKRVDEPIVVVRFDGIRRRGESHIDPDCRTPGRENCRFTFSQGVDDIAATVNFLHRDPRFLPSRIVLITFSAAAVEGRRAVATDVENRIAGWISVVGMADPQSALRTISGGIDYVYGIERGMQFGLQEILGVVVDIDRVGLDGIEKRLVRLEDARRDMDQIRVPVTWIHAKHDAWVDLGRVRDILSCGDVSRRKLIEVPTGHQLRTSREALGTFQLISREVARMALGRELPVALPSPVALEKRHARERSRISDVTVDLRRFWHDYLLGRDGKIGIDLVTATTAYSRFLRDQAERLGIRAGDRIADLGAGTGAFLRWLTEAQGLDKDVEVHGIDFVVEALARGRSAASARREGVPLLASHIAADLNIHRGRAIPVRTETYSGVLASLLISYVAEPSSLLREIRRILRPEGRLVVSSMRRDSDISKLYVDSVQEMHAGRADEAFGHEIGARFDELSRPFVNDAARLLELEEAGRFRFWDLDELCELVEGAGFKDVDCSLSLGDPPQAVIVSARK